MVILPVRTAPDVLVDQYLATAGLELVVHRHDPPGDVMFPLRRAPRLAGRGAGLSFDPAASGSPATATGRLAGRQAATVATMTAELVHLAVQSGIATITLDSPANRNALSSALRAQLSDALARSVADDSIRAVVLDHTGPVFCAGMDLTEPPDAVSELPGILKRISNHPKPVVAKLGGHARAGGIGLLAAADIGVAAQHATFAFSEVRIGVVPAVISVTVLPRVLRHAAHELFLTGEIFDAARANAIGLLNSVVPADQLDGEVDRFTGMLTKGGPQALSLTKQLLRGAGPGDFAAMLEISAARFASAEGREGIRAYAEKRPPEWARTS